MMTIQPLRLLLLFIITISPILLLASANVDIEEATRYSTLPPTVFAPNGRLFGVERVAREAITLPPSSSSLDEESCCTTVLAIRCGARLKGSQESSSRGELTIMVGIGPISPSLHRDVELFQQQQQQSKKTQEQQLSSSSSSLDQELNNDNEQQFTTSITTTTTSAHNNTTKPSFFYKPLQIPSTSSSTLPISILSPTLITATGGTSSIDSSILLRRSIEVALSLYKLDNGGIDLFASHSLEGTAATRSSRTMSTSYGGDTNDNSSIEGGGGGGGASNVKIEALVRRIADMAQSSTQNLGGKYGRMLSSSLLAMGVQDQPPSPPPQQQQQQQTNHETNHETEQNDNDDKLCLWRVDPTGQFWKCDASAVGRGTVEVEEELLNRVRQWKKKNNNKKKNEHDDTSSSVAVVQSTITSSLTDNYNNGDDELNQ
eukprot:scaffold6160_cov104-Skeletonema_menzelii.AAC.1